jgi:hypothetical protein
MAMLISVISDVCIDLFRNEHPCFIITNSIYFCHDFVTDTNKLITKQTHPTLFNFLLSHTFHICTVQLFVGHAVLNTKTTLKYRAQYYKPVNLMYTLSSFLGYTAQLRPWPPPQNPAEFLGGFSTIFFLQCRVVSPTPNPHPRGPDLCIYIPQRQGGYPF